jgi:hypothetical protein
MLAHASSHYYQHQWEVWRGPFGIVRTACMVLTGYWGLFFFTGISSVSALCTEYLELVIRTSLRDDLDPLCRCQILVVEDGVERQYQIRHPVVS